MTQPAGPLKTLQGRDALYSVQDEYRRNGLYTVAGIHGSIDVGINLIKEYLHINPNRIHLFRQERGAPRLYIVRSRRPNLWREITELKREIQSSGHLKFVGDDHAVDCLRYVVMSRPQPPRHTKPDPYEHLKLTSPASYREWHNERQMRQRWRGGEGWTLGDFG